MEKQEALGGEDFSRQRLSFASVPGFFSTLALQVEFPELHPGPAEATGAQARILQKPHEAMKYSSAVVSQFSGNPGIPEKPAPPPAPHPGNAV